MSNAAKLNVLFAGDGPADGAARYWLAILKTAGAKVLHVPPSKPLPVSCFEKRWDCILLSDMPCAKVSAAAQQRIEQQVDGGAGLAMIGGWASFSGNYGGWRGSGVSSLLPVHCSAKDDRLNLPGGLLVIPASRHPITDGLPLQRPPVICGLNAVRPKAGARTLLKAQPLRVGGSGAHRTVTLSRRAYPLLVVDENRKRRTAAFTSDFAPHWAGGLVDWGRKRKVVRLPRDEVEVGEAYIQFGIQFLQWLSGR